MGTSMYRAPLLRCEDVGRRFGSRWVLAGVSLALAPGDVLAVLGANGSGKSTLLRILAGLLAPSRGRVARPPGEVRHTIGYAAPDVALYPTLTPGEHLDLTGRLRGVPARTTELLERVGLAAAAGQWARELSTGMRARLKLAIALQASPPVLVLDEPTAALDENGRALVAGIVAERRDAVTVLATNDPSDVAMAGLQLRLNG